MSAKDTPFPSSTPPLNCPWATPFRARLGLSSSLESVSWPDDSGIKCAKITLQLCGVRDVLLKNYGSGNFRLASESLPPTLAPLSPPLPLCPMPPLATSLSRHCSCFMTMLKLPKLQSLCVLLGYYDRPRRGSSWSVCIRVCMCV